ncbi:hypothetical protein [Tomitella fengzijianii]|uniref:Uncharacterized protein n=1 Tax=Tomitella fengzijianii TaxID=2597660 RepID=A0A516X6L2_9ACTN|nr:hypothetical protein [Tomitella fengzijianii]QDQ98717.1 hypothetical protein FO059_16995 [Tomitella fengzijianii]
MSAKVLTRGAAAVGAAAVLLGGAVLTSGAMLGAGTASAAGSVAAGPVPADPVTASIEHLGDVVLYQSGLQVYEVAEVRPAENTSPPADELVLRRVHSAGDGIPGAPRFAFVGAPLPEAFVVAQAWEQPGVPSGLIVPADPVTLEQLPLGENLRMVSVLAGPLGPFAGAGMSTPYLG